MLQDSIKLIRNAFTRWLTHDGCTRSLFQSLPAVLAHLYNTRRADVTAMFLYVLLCDYRFYASLLTMRDILPPMTKLSLVLHEKIPDLNKLMMAAPAAIKTIQGKPLRLQGSSTHSQVQILPANQSLDPSALRAVRSRSGRARKEREHLSFNHRDPLAASRCCSTKIYLSIHSDSS